MGIQRLFAGLRCRWCSNQLQRERVSLARGCHGLQASPEHDAGKETAGTRTGKRSSTHWRHWDWTIKQHLEEMMFDSPNGCSWLSRAARHFHTDILVSRKPWEASLSYLQCSCISQLLPARYHCVVSETRSQHKRLNKINKVIHYQFSHAREKKEKEKRLFTTSSCSRDKINKVIPDQFMHER